LVGLEVEGNPKITTHNKNVLSFPLCSIPFPPSPLHIHLSPSLQSGAVRRFSEPGDWGRSRRRGSDLTPWRPGGIRTNWARRAGQKCAGTCSPEYEARWFDTTIYWQRPRRAFGGDTRKIAGDFVIVKMAKATKCRSSDIFGVDAEKKRGQAKPERCARPPRPDKWATSDRFNGFEDGRFDSIYWQRAESSS